jgi:hypothetical protein
VRTFVLALALWASLVGSASAAPLRGPRPPTFHGVLTLSAPVEPVKAAAWVGLRVVNLGAALRSAQLSRRETMLFSMLAPFGLSLALGPNQETSGLLGVLRGGVYLNGIGGHLNSGRWVGVALGYRQRNVRVGLDLWRLMDRQKTAFAAPFVGVGF